ncbi:hypothetical protein SmJEL517_g05227 [Synchytrium microbalum]|uniref:Conserved oligomeric Golgi complex subunit 1 n=1 Tax=Synchytrium microbalum TaxID=1806994 RepID=A0A507BW45_9FUNG|nr:uncharacterized protein SmJEL517_g05227 [Synchytrium microbalum]TPX31408.1 hypothetical protein SmJEL517_g05227 [Synchytrium microbalum]
MATTKSANRDANDLFRKHTIHEIRAMHAELGKDVENKKQELRSMVGERYRDLIIAADSISTMKDVASNIQSLISDIQDGCDTLNVKRTINNEKSSSKLSNDADADRKKQLYPIAAQIKLLVDTPEQIWHALEHHQYLRASQLYMLARLIFKNIHSSKDALSTKAQTSFPVVQRQWEAVSHFRAPIVQRATAHLKETTQTPQELANTLCAMMLLDGAPPSEALQKLLDMRRIAAMEILTDTKTDSTPATLICTVITLIEVTLRQTATCFLAPPRPPGTPSSTPIGLSLLETCVRKLTSTTKTTLDAQHSALSGLYSEKTNLHILFRHLPPAVQSFVPYLHLPNPSSIVPESEVRKLVAACIERLMKEVNDGAYQVLKTRVGSGIRLSQVRQSVLDKISSIEIVPSAENGHSPSPSSPAKSAPQIPWSSITSQLLESRFSFWTSLLRSTFFRRAKDLIEASFTVITTQPSTLYTSKLESLSTQDRNMEGFIWAAESDGVLRGWTPSIAEITGKFEKGIMEVRADIEPLFAGSSVKDDEDPFDLQIDAKSLAKAYQECTSMALQGYRDGLIALLDATRPRGEHTPSERELRVDQGLFIGRAAQAIVTRSKAFASALFLEEPLSSSVTGNSSRTSRTRRPSFRSGSTLSLRVLGAVEPDPRLSHLNRMMMEVYILSHGPWTRSTADSIATLVTKSLKSFDWRQVNALTEVWEPVSIQGTNDAGESIEEKVSLPVFASSFLVDGLWSACKEINRVAGFSLDKTVLRNFLLELSRRTLQSYEDFCNSVLMTDSVSEKSAFQLLFDLRFLYKVFEGAWNPPQQQSSSDMGIGHIGLELESKSHDVLSRIKSKIDPIDLAIVDAPIRGNVERFYVRTRSMFGGMLDLNAIPQEGRTNPALHELHNVIALAQGAPRFTLLPVPAPLASRTSQFRLARAGKMESSGALPPLVTPPTKLIPQPTATTATSQDTSSPSARYRAAIRVAQRTAPSIETSTTSASSIFSNAAATMAGAAGSPAIGLAGVNQLAQGGQQALQRGTEYLMNAGGFLGGLLGGSQGNLASPGGGSVAGQRPASPAVVKTASHR